MHTVAAAGGACLQMFSEHPCMSFAMRREVYVAKVRSCVGVAKGNCGTES